MPRLLKLNASEMFIDSNIWLYAFTAHPQWGGACHDLLKKIETEQVEGFTSPLVIAETIHKLMLFEVRDRFKILLPSAVSYLKKNYAVIPTLGQFQKALERIYVRSNVTILEISNTVFALSYSLINKYQLLSFDALHAATCLAYNIRHFATNDKDFKRVKELTIWSP
ncbi:MAG: PIN domain-containing protein [candidate division KSB1 bacterium]